MVNYHTQRSLGLLAPTEYARTTRLSPVFRVRVWLRETSTSYCTMLREKKKLCHLCQKDRYAIATIQ